MTMFTAKQTLFFQLTKLCLRSSYNRTFRLQAAQLSEWTTSDQYMNPIDELQSVCQVPLFSASELVFMPTVAQLKKADDLFKMSLANQSIATIKGVINTDGLPPTNVPEVCFIGQSNVGKSSLIKSLFYNPAVKISVSKKPGHTRAMQFYELGRLFTLVDMPGYGTNMPDHYPESVERYIRMRPRLVRTFLLLDAEDGITEMDVIGIKMMEEFGRPYAIVVTKIDRTTPHKVLRNILDLKQRRNLLMPSALPQPFLVSAHCNYGLVLLRAFIAHVTGHLPLL